MIRTEPAVHAAAALAATLEGVSLSQLAEAALTMRAEGTVQKMAPAIG